MIQGFADSFPSESIQAHSSPGLAVSVVFPFMESDGILDVPIAQYKNVKLRNKADRAKVLAEWLRKKKSQGLVMPGFMIADTWQNAADFGLRFLEAIPNAEVIPHYDSYRLKFGEQVVDLPQAVALQYYFFIMHMGCLRAGLKLVPELRNLVVLMDRFPHTQVGDVEPNTKIPPTPGAKLLEYMEKECYSWKSLQEENRSIDLNVRFGNLNWWKDDDSKEWQGGKTHPHFKLPDWLNQAIIADTHYDDFMAAFNNPALGREIADALKELRNAFSEFQIWTLSSKAINHIMPSETTWAVPTEARQFILDRLNKKIS